MGVARTVIAPVEGPGAVPARFADALTRWKTRDTVGAAAGRKHEQILSLFGRWVLPGDGLEVYGEWARQELPTSLADFVGRPGYTQGYTLGLQWARQLASEGVFRLQSELTYLEQTSRTSPTSGYHLVRSFYTSASIPQGYTHRGQSLGAAIGPGSSSQWNAADYLKARWQLGAFVGRARWDTGEEQVPPPHPAVPGVRDPSPGLHGVQNGVRHRLARSLRGVVVHHHDE